MAADKIGGVCVQKFPWCYSRGRLPPHRIRRNALRRRRLHQEYLTAHLDSREHTRGPSRRQGKDLRLRLQQSVPSAHRVQCPPWEKKPSAHRRRKLPAPRLAPLSLPVQVPTWRPSQEEVEM